ncbi:hypothetical protein [Pelomonas sp. KK5]|uniref:hypothetical protein n=1 Tax=Pelomonas sp. KK5 TaxID=1855730 RepID=UPI00097C568B|nr:hypothetical protein [Pelomonas sp. KK5]
MSEKNLTEAEWKKFAKGRSLKDAPLIKALADLDKAKTPQAELTALDDIGKQADILRKASKSDKEVTAYFDVLDKSVDKQRKASDAEAKKLEKAEKEKAAAEKEKADKAAAASGDDDEESSALLTSKMIPVMKAVPKGDVMFTMIAVMGKDVVVLVSRKPISPSKRKLLTDELGTTSGVKFVVGECIWEANAHTFVVKTQAAGLAKKLKAALLKQTGMRYKVRVRGEDPDDIDDDGEDFVAAVEDAASKAAPAAEARAPEPEPEPEARAEPAGEAPAVKKGDGEAEADDAERAQFDARLAEMEPQILAALRAQSPDAGKIRALSEFAGEKGEAGNYKAALGALDQIAKLLAAPTPAAAAGSANPADPGPAFNARLAALLPHIKTALAAGGDAAGRIRQGVADAGDLARKKDFAAAQGLLDQVEQWLSETPAPAAGGAAKPTPSLVELQKARLTWDGLRKTVQSQFSSIESAVMAAVREHNADPEAEDRFDEAALGTGLKQLFDKLDTMDQGLIDKLDEALNAEGAQRDARYAEAAVLVQKFRAFASGDPLLAFVDDNGFASTDIRAKVDGALADLSAQF